MENIDINELENNIINENRVDCTNCKNNVLLKKQYNDAILPSSAKFALFIGPITMTVLCINVFLLIKSKFMKLPDDIKKHIDDKHIFELPIRYSIKCSECNYIFYENLRIKDLLIGALCFWIFIVIIALFIVFFR